MSSINPYFTFEYSQPEEYHFSHDSVFLARWVFENFKPHKRTHWEVLDLCAGTGIIGLDFLFHLLSNKKTDLPSCVDFVEVQSVYKSHFEKNCLQLPSYGVKLNWIQQNLKDLEGLKKYDLVVCNPPYFRLGQGKLSSSEFKNRCRFFLDSSFEEFLSFLGKCLAPQGEAFILIRNLQDHGWNPYGEIKEKFERLFEISIETQIRGTDVVRLRHLKS